MRLLRVATFSVAVALLAACATPSQSPGRTNTPTQATLPALPRVQAVLSDHGFAPPLQVERGDGSTWWVSERPAPHARECLDRIVVRTTTAAAPTVEMVRWTRGPSDWAQLGTLFVGSSLQVEAGEMERALR